MSGCIGFSDVAKSAFEEGLRYLQDGALPFVPPVYTGREHIAEQ